MNLPLSTRKIVHYIARRIGLDPEVNLSPDQAYEILSSMDDRLRECWEMYDFLEITRIEERAFAPDYDSSLCYEAGAIVWDWCSRSYYEAVMTGVGGPLSNPGLWTPLPKTSPAYIDWFQLGKTPIGACFKAYTLNPFEAPKAVEVPFVISPRGLAFVAENTPATVWIVFRVPYPGLGMFDWEATSVYATGDAVIFGDDTYHSLIDGNVGLQPDLLVGAEAWLIFKIPYVLGRFVQQASFSDSLVTNGQNEKAQAEEGKAYAYVSAEYDKQTLQQAQQQRFSVNIPV
jgi:hypothetical protein